MEEPGKFRQVTQKTGVLNFSFRKFAKILCWVIINICKYFLKFKVGHRLRDVSAAILYFCPATVIRYLSYVTRVHVIKDKNVKNVFNVQNVTGLHREN